MDELQEGSLVMAVAAQGSDSIDPDLTGLTGRVVCRHSNGYVDVVFPGRDKPVLLPPWVLNELPPTPVEVTNEYFPELRWILLES